ncbi:DNA polymerase III subunit gamma/tau [Rickettsiales bacterium]|nr:DNA polymerase III subunit gamma/tau [Rickettsiales bacterium]
MSENNHYVVLARKYRPKKLSDLIGQDEIRTILKGALRLNRLAHAYLLSGTRGVGKTTLARIISKVVNCSSKTEDLVGDPCGKCENCISIDNESNIDVVELDAASRTGVSDVREIIENINYKPVSALKKIYIIDEVHMLSKAAFNALLKTLEEPPNDVLFLLATTETEKIPITILSRCQHLELKRIDTKVLSEHIMKISSHEDISLDKESSDIIARSAEGSVRDALSILDNVLTRGNLITKEIVNEVLGLSDLTKVFSLFDSICRGNVSESLKVTNSMYINGASLERLAKEILNIIYYTARFKSEFSEEDINLNEYEISIFKKYAKNLDMDVVIRFWETMQRYFDELIKSFDQRKSFEMIVIRLCYISLLPTPFEALNKKEEIVESKIQNNVLPKNRISRDFLQKNNLAEKKDPVINNEIENKAKTVSLGKGSLKKFEKLVDMIEKKSEFMISHQLINNFKLVSIKLPEENGNTGILDLKNLFEIKAQDNILWKVSKILKDITGYRWLVSIISNGGSKTLNEVYLEREELRIKTISNESEIKKLLEIIPGSEIVSIEESKN